jgi:phosphoglycerol geranylgeranyltransferase
MQLNWKDWVHVTKLDPDKNLDPESLTDIVTSGTDALMLSGTLNVTQENLSCLLEQVSAYGLPLVVEPAGPEAVLFEGIDALFVPSVLNTSDVRWIVGKHKTWVKHSRVRWDIVVPEAYIVLNPASAVGRVTGADCTLRADDVAAYATVAEQYFHFPIVYIEYSGTYGDPAIVQAAAAALDTTLLYYGGGINSAERAAEMARYADTIVVGNAVYDEGAAILKATVRAVS